MSMKNNIKPYRVVLPDAWKSKDRTKVLKLDWNEATINPSQNVLQALINELKNGYLNWYPNINNELLYDKISKYTKINSNLIEIFAGSDSLHEVISRSLLKEGDRVCIVAPTYDNFRATVEMSGASVEYFNLDNEFNLDFEKLSNQLFKSKPKLLYIVNPNNPTGNAHDFISLKKLIYSHIDINFIIDEAYYEFHKISLSGLVDMVDNLIICRTFSKAFSLASFRIGYAIASSKLIELLRLNRNPKSIPQLAQIAAIASLDDLDHMNNYVNEVLNARSHFLLELKKHTFLKAYDSDANFVLIKCVSNDLKNSLIKYLSTKEVYVRDFTHLANMDSFFRITIGTKKEMNFVLELINEFELQYFLKV